LEKAGFEYLGYLPSYIDPPPVVDHQFKMTGDRFFSTARRPVKVELAAETGRQRSYVRVRGEVVAVFAGFFFAGAGGRRD
jgi:hypothetical protein